MSLNRACVFLILNNVLGRQKSLRKSEQKLLTTYFCSGRFKLLYFYVLGTDVRNLIAGEFGLVYVCVCVCEGPFWFSV